MRNDADTEHQIKGAFGKGFQIFHHPTGGNHNDENRGDYFQQTSESVSICVRA